MRNCSTCSISVKELNLLLIPLAAELEKTVFMLPIQSSSCVYVTLFSKNVLVLPLATASASCVRQVCSQGAVMLFSSFSSPRDQNTVRARCSGVCRQ